MLEKKENLSAEDTDIVKRKSHILAVIIGLATILAIGFLVFLKDYKTTERKEQGEKQNELDTRKATKISVDDLQNKINKGEAIAVVDIRTTQQYKNEHIKDSKNISISDFQNLWSSLDKNKSYVIVDDGKDDEAAITALEMNKEGFKNTYYLGGGYIAWQNKNKPTVSKGDPLSAADIVKVSFISPDDLNSWLSNPEEKKDLFLIDVRSVNIYAQGHLENSVNIPLDDLESRSKEIPLNKDLVIYGYTNLSSFRGSVKLFDLGYFNALSLSGGIEEWKKKGFKMIK